MTHFDTYFMVTSLFAAFFDTSLSVIPICLKGPVGTGILATGIKHAAAADTSNNASAVNAQNNL
jgi:hypothetical protein